MVDFIGTNLSEASGNAEGGTTSFANRLDAATLAAVGDPTVERGGIESFYSADDASKFHANVAEIAQDLVKQSPVPLNLKQAKFLVYSYYDQGAVWGSGIIEAMKKDGSLVPVSDPRGWYFNCSKIPGIKLAYALWNAGGMTSPSPITAAQFDTATDSLFGDIGGVTPQMAAFLTSAFGTNGTLSLAQVAAIFDSESILLGVAKEIGDYVKVTVNFDAVPVRSDIPTIAAFLMCYDQNNDGLLSHQELRSNNQERRLYFETSGDSVGGDFATMETYLACYGKKDASGTMVLDLDAVTAMLTDGSLSLAANADSWGAPFATNLKAIPIERVISGATYGDGGSLNDGILSNGELVTLFGKLGQNVTSKQAQFLINVYGDGTSMTTANVQQMRNDGFLTTGSFVSDKATLNWDNIDGGLISDAMYRAVGVAAGTGLTADQFDTATDTLFGDTAGVNPQQAAFLTRIFGTDSTLNSAQIAGIFENNIISINGVGGESYVRIAVKTSNYNPLFSDNATAANYIAMFDTNYDGWLDAGELQAAINSRTTDGVSADDKITQTYMNCYGEKASGGNMLISRDGVMAMLADTSLTLMPVAPNRGFAVGFDINLNAIPTALLLRGQAYGYVSGVLLARAIFKQVGVDPDTAGATATATQFNNGFKLLYSATPDKTLTDPAILAKYFGTGSLLTVAQMGTALDSINTDVSIGLVPVKGGGHEHATGMHLAFHSTDWWNSVLKFVGDGVEEVVSTISTISGVGQEIIAGIFNGTMTMDVAFAKGGYKIVTAISQAIKNGEASAKQLMGTLGKAINAAILDLSTEGKAVIDQMVKAAEDAGEEVAIRTLSMLSGMSPADAKKAIETLASKSKMNDAAKNFTFEDMKALVPDYDTVIAELEEQVNTFTSTIQSNATELASLAAQGYTFNSDNKLVKSGAVLSEIETQDFFARHYRADFGFEANAAVTNKFALTAGQFRVFVAYAGKDANGNSQVQLRIRLIGEAGVAVGLSDNVSVDAGLITVHDLIMSWSVPPVGDAKKNDILWNSTLAVIGEGDGPAKLFEILNVPLVLTEIATSTFKIGAAIEVGFGGGCSVTYNLSKMGDRWYTPFLAELAGGVAGAAVAVGALSLATAVSEGTMAPLLPFIGPVAVQAGIMIGGFMADIAYAGLDNNKGEVSLSGGAFVWFAERVGAGVGNTIGGTGASFQIRERGQFNIGTESYMLM